MAVRGDGAGRRRHVADHRSRSGPGVSGIFGAGITSYEWGWVVAPDRVEVLLRRTGGEDGADVLEVLAASHEQPRPDQQLAEEPGNRSRVQQLAFLAPLLAARHGLLTVALHPTRPE